MKKSNLLSFSLLIVLLIVSGLYYRNFIEIRKLNNNISATTDSLKITKNKLNESVYSSGILLMNYKELKNINSGLVSEINKLSKKDKKNLIEINKLNIQINLLKDSIIKIKGNLVDSTYNPIDSTINSNYHICDSTEYRVVEGNVRIVSKDLPKSVNVELSKLNIYTDLVISKIADDNKIRLSVSSSNPGLVVTNIEGSVIDLTAYNKFQKPKKFSIGLQCGYGFTNKGLSPYIGIGLTYSLIRW
jgi:hypothetical protein